MKSLRFLGVAFAALLLPVVARADERVVNFYNWADYIEPSVLAWKIRLKSMPTETNASKDPEMFR